MIGTSFSNRGAVWLSILSVLLWRAFSFAQLVPYAGKPEEGGPGFDPTPVQLPSVVSGERRPITNMDLLTIRDLKGVQISPDGKSVAFVVSQAVYNTNSYRTAIFVVGTEPGSKPINLGTAGPPRWNGGGEWWNEPPIWSPDSRYITYRVRNGATWQIFRWNRNGGAPVHLTHSPYDIQWFEWSPDGNSITFEIEKPLDPDESRRLSERGMLYDESIADPFNNTPIVDMLSKRIPERQIWLYDVRRGREHRATGEEITRYDSWHYTLHDPAITKQNISPDRNTLAFIKALKVEDGKVEHVSMSLCVRPMSGGAPIVLARDVGYFWWASDSNQLYFLGDSGYDRPLSLYVVDSNGGTTRELVHFNTFFGQLSLNSSASLAAGALQTTTDPAEVALADLKTGEVRVLVNVNPEFERIELSPITEITWKNKKGDPEFGYLIKPLNYHQGKKYPLIVTTYRVFRQAFQRGAVGDEYPMQVFAANGFLVLAVDVDEFMSYEPKNFEDAKNAIWFSLIPNLKTAVKILEDMGIVDPDHKGITGLSYGSRIVNFMISHSDLFEAAIASGLAADDPFSYYIGGGRIQGDFASFGLGGLPEGEAWSKWREFSPALNAQYVKAPLLVNAADSEYRAGLQFYTSLKRLGKPVELFVYPNEFHEKNQPKHRLEIYQRNLDWFNFWFKGEEDPDPAKADQYTRWRELRKLQEANEAARKPD